MKKGRIPRRWQLVLLAMVTFLVCSISADAQVFSNGDVFVAIGHSQVQWRRGNGALVKTLTATVTNNINMTGMAFDSAGNLYASMFDSQAVAVFDNSGDFLTTFGSGYNLDPESIVIDSNRNVYVGQADGSHEILKFDSTGTLLAQYTVTPDQRGSDWIDLAGDLCTMYFTSEGKNVQRFNVCTGVQLSNLNPAPLPGTFAYAHRLRSNGETLVADTEFVVRLDSAGAVIQTYTAPGTNNFFALNLDPDGTSFWTGDLSNGNVYKYDIRTGNILLQFNAGGGSNIVGGITVKGELTASAGPPPTTCVTRNSRFWFTHAYSLFGTNCVTLLRALQANLGGINLGYVSLPAFYEDSNSTKDANDAMQEALGFYLRSKSRTRDGATASSLCRSRKKLSVELIAATANVVLLGTQPQNCTYQSGLTTLSFPADLLHQARQVAAGDDPVACKAMTALLRTFNSNGVTNNFNGELVECSPLPNKILRSIARDPTTSFNCPGPNNSCATAQTVVFQNATNAFAKARFSTTVDMSQFASLEAFWKITPPTAAAGRSFKANTSGSAFDNILTVLTGTCTVTTSNGNTIVDESGLTSIVSNESTNGTFASAVNFTTDGTNTYYIRATPGTSVAPGRLKIQVSSP
jgi:hypothetical protein